MKFTKNIPIFILVALMSACGGGGGGGTPAPVASTAAFSLAASAASSFQDTSTQSFTVSGKSSGISFTGSGTVTRGNVTAATFEGTSALQKTTIVSGSITGNGITVPISSSSTSYVDTNYVPLGRSGSTEYMVVSSTPPLPTSAYINDTGTYYVGNRYTDGSKSTLLGTASVTYALQPDTADTALLVLIYTEKDVAGSITMTSTSKIRLTPAGAATDLSESALYSNGDVTNIYY